MGIYADNFLGIPIRVLFRTFTLLMYDVQLLVLGVASRWLAKSLSTGKSHRRY